MSEDTPDSEEETESEDPFGDLDPDDAFEELDAAEDGEKTVEGEGNEGGEEPFEGLATGDPFEGLDRPDPGGEASEADQPAEPDETEKAEESSFGGLAETEDPFGAIEGGEPGASGGADRGAEADAAESAGAADADAEDPVELLGEGVEGRTGDPFEALDDEQVERLSGPEEGPIREREASAGEGDADSESGAEPGPAAEIVEEPAVETGEPEWGVQTEPTGTEGEAGDPGGEGDPFEAAESLFERMDVESLDPDEVWQNLSEARERGSVAGDRERTYAEVSKHSYCEQCEYFSDPPEIACSNEGTEILEFPDMETVRVVDCPVVAERQQLDEES